MALRREIPRPAYKLSKIPKWSNIYVSPDYTHKEREANKILREELKRCKENGEVNLGISNGMIVVKQPRSGGNQSDWNDASPGISSSNQTDQMDASSGTNHSQ